MPRPDCADHAGNTRLLDTYKNDKELCGCWFQEYREIVKLYASFNKELKNYSSSDINYIVLAQQMGIVTRGFVEAGYYKKRSPLHDRCVAGIERIKVDQIMPKLGLGDSKDDPKLGRWKTDVLIRLKDLLIQS